MSYFDMKRGCPVSYEEAASSWITRMHLPMTDRMEVEDRMRRDEEARKPREPIITSRPLDNLKFLLPEE